MQLIVLLAFFGMAWCVLAVCVVMMTTGPRGKLVLKPGKNKSFGNVAGTGGGNNACAKYCGPRYFVGGAFPALMQDMSNRKMPSGVGLHLHPMGLGSAIQGGYMPRLLSQFSTREYFYEADLDAWTDGSNPIQTNTPGHWGSLLNSGQGGWRCALFAPWAKSADMANPERVIPKYKQVFDKIRAWGCRQCWIFWSPPSEPQYNSAVMRSQAWARVAKETGATGICVDHPANRGDSLDVSFAALKWAKQNGLGAGWVLNGSGSATQVAALVKKIKANVGSVDFISSDNFSSQQSGWAAAQTELDAAKL